MAQKKRANRWLVAALAGFFLMASGGFALAASSDTADTSSNPIKAFCGRMMGKADPAQRSAELQNIVDKLVADNVLNQQQADELVSYLKTQTEKRLADREEMKDLTPEQRQAQRQEQRAPQGFLDQAVADQIITQEQAQAIDDALRQQQQESRETALQDRLAEFVTKGVISQSQADAVKAALQSQQQERQAEMDKVRDMTPAERQNYMQQNRPQKQQPLQELVQNGTLTQEQANQICPAPQGQGQGNAFKGKAMGRGCQNCPDRQATATNA